MVWFWTILIVLFTFISIIYWQRAYSRCPRCGWSNPSKAEYCTNCGIPLKTEKKKEKSSNEVG